MQSWKTACRGLAKGVKGRCRNNDSLVDGFCAVHPEQMSVGLADIVLVKFNLNEDQTEAARQAGFLFEEKGVSAVLVDARRENTAEGQGREAYRYRDTRPDTGVLVFAPQLEAVTPRGIFEELSESGYIPTAGKLKEKFGGKKGAILVLVFEIDPKEQMDLTKDQISFTDRLEAATWRYCQVYSNPANGDGKRTDTVNLNVQDRGLAKVRLAHGDGTWRASEL